MKGGVGYDSETILRDLVAIVEEMTSDWDNEYGGGIGAQTKLIGELAFESIDVVEFILAVEQHFDPFKPRFEKLIMEDGRYVDEIVLGDVARFLQEEFQRLTSG